MHLGLYVHTNTLTFTKNYILAFPIFVTISSRTEYFISKISCVAYDNLVLDHHHLEYQCMTVRCDIIYSHIAQPLVLTLLSLTRLTNKMICIHKHMYI